MAISTPANGNKTKWWGKGFITLQMVIPLRVNGMMDSNKVMGLRNQLMVNSMMASGKSIKSAAEESSNFQTEMYTAVNLKMINYTVLEP